MNDQKETQTDPFPSRFTKLITIVAFCISANNDIPKKQVEEKRPERWYHFFGRADGSDWKVICKFFYLTIAFYFQKKSRPSTVSNQFPTLMYSEKVHRSKLCNSFNLQNWLNRFFMSKSVNIQSMILKYVMYNLRHGRSQN